MSYQLRFGADYGRNTAWFVSQKYFTVPENCLDFFFSWAVLFFLSVPPGANFLCLETFPLWAGPDAIISWNI